MRQSFVRISRFCVLSDRVRRRKIGIGYQVLNISRDLYDKTDRVGGGGGGAILPVILYGCEPRALTMRERHRPRVCGNRVLRKIRKWADKFCLQCNIIIIIIYIRHIWIKPDLCSRMVSLFHHTSPWAHRSLQSSHSKHRNGRVFRRSVQTACCCWILNRGKSSSNWNFRDECKPFVVIGVLLWVQLRRWVRWSLRWGNVFKNKTLFF